MNQYPSINIPAIVNKLVSECQAEMKDSQAEDLNNFLREFKDLESRNTIFKMLIE